MIHKTKNLQLISKKLTIMFIGITALSFGIIQSPVFAAGSTFTVTSTLDTSDSSAGDTICDDGAGNCTLRAAIEEVNSLSGSSSGPFIINFNIPGQGSSQQVITLNSPLPNISSNTTIDASTDQIANGGSPNGTTCGDLWGVGGAHIDPVWKIKITASGAPVNWVGITIGNTATNVKIRGLQMTGFYSGNQGSVPALDVDGSSAVITCNYFTVNGKNVRVHGSNHMIGGPSVGDGNVFNGNQQNESLPMLNTTNVTVQGNFFGTNPSGTATSINAVGVASERGINLESAIGTHVGGTVFGQGNLFSGNTDGINLTSSPDSLTTPTSNTIIEGNYFGTDVTGTIALGNTNTGISVKFATNTLIGGTTTGSRNVIAGTTGLTSGISIRENATTTTVKGNYIGTDKTGNSPLGSNFGVMFQDGAQDNIVGGTTIADRNIISGNAVGVQFLSLGGGTISRNTVLGNYIGVGADGTTSVPNTNYGISLVGQTVANNVIGGTTAGSGNKIANNGKSEISTFDPIPGFGFPHSAAGSGNAFIGNSITNNGGIGIDLSTDYYPTVDASLPTQNDTSDPDMGPNDMQNYPVLTSVTTGASTTVSGTINSIANKQYRVEFFSNTAVDASGYGEGQEYLGSKIVTTDSAGDATFTATGLAPTSQGSIITSTASQMIDDGSGGYYYSTSEFSAPAPTPVSYTLTYTAGQNGSITGTLSQTVVSGSNGTTVTAVPNAGYVFEKWSDNSTTNPRTDTNVTGNISVTASFKQMMVAANNYTSSGYSPRLDTRLCQDTKAVNYLQNLPCTYKEFANAKDILTKGNLCEAKLIIHDFMKEGDRDKKHSSYNKKTITEVNLLQAHINRILRAEYEQAAGPVDGIFGPLTKQGVKRIQHVLDSVFNLDLGPTGVDGIVGPFTRDAINHSC